MRNNDSKNYCEISEESKTKKIIIKNCPALSYGRNSFKKCYRQNWSEHCKDRPDCILKRIAQLSDSEYQCDNCNGAGYLNGCLDNNCSYYRLMKIKELIEIEEVNVDSSKS